MRCAYLPIARSLFHILIVINDHLWSLLHINWVRTRIRVYLRWAMVCVYVCARARDGMCLRNEANIWDQLISHYESPQNRLDYWPTCCCWLFICRRAFTIVTAIDIDAIKSEEKFQKKRNCINHTNKRYETNQLEHLEWNEIQNPFCCLQATMWFSSSPKSG